MNSLDASAAPNTAPHDAPQVRSGPELIKASQAFQTENRWTSWKLLLTTLSALVAGLFLVLWIEPWPIKILAGALVGLVQVRLFIFYHDALHGAIFSRDPVAQVFMRLVGVYLMILHGVWKETHDHHHQNNARQLGSSIGTFPVLTIAMLQRLSRWDRLRYRIARHGLTMLAGSLTMMLGGMVWAPLMRQPRRHWGGPLAVALHILVFIAVGWYAGWINALCLLTVPCLVSMAIGTYLFYAQHNFPAMKLTSRTEWTFAAAAMQASSMFDMSPLMRWFTGDIGYHHVHHLNHRIPFYRLREAMQAIPELQQPGRTSWHIRDIRACLDLCVWDPELQRMLSWREARSRLDVRAA
jgi:omega-6 fatty acid desaturase (delta-12 desaturase)